MKKKLAFVLAGGASRGALQAGALRALFESGYRPDLIVGTSIGAANGSFLAVHGFNEPGLQKMEEFWRSVASQSPMPANLWWEAMRVFLHRSHGASMERIREIAISFGLTPDLRFKDLRYTPYYTVAADLRGGCSVVFGVDPNERVLDSLLASMALTPWVAPIEKDGRLLIDGGAVSNLPVEEAIRLGAAEIIALDLCIPDMEIPALPHGLGEFVMHLENTVMKRQLALELELAEARGVEVRYIPLLSQEPLPFWDFSHSVEWMAQGHAQACRSIAGWPHHPRASWWRRPDLQEIIEEVLEVFD